MSIILADRDARIIGRWAGKRELLTRLDNATVAPGFQFAEEFAGTNAIGTALEERTSFRVEGEEHLLETLHEFACVGAPIIHPINRSVVGILDFASKVSDVNDLMAPLISAAVTDIEERLYGQSSRTERRLLREYAQVRRSAAKAVVAMSPDTVIATPLASSFLDYSDQAMLWDWASGTPSNRHHHTETLRLADGRDVEVTAHRVSEAAEPLGVVMELRNITEPTAKRAQLPTLMATLPAGPSRPETERLSGRSLATAQLQSQIDGFAQQTGPVLFTGETGVGKRRTAAYLTRLWGFANRLFTVPGADLTLAELARLRTELDDGSAVLITRIDEVPTEVTASVRNFLTEMSGTRFPLAATSSTELRGDDAGGLSSYFIRRAFVSPLRHRLDEIDDLARVVLAEHVPGTRIPRLRPAARKSLTAHHWPGNVREFASVIVSSLPRAMGSDIRLEHLPAEYQTITDGRKLTSLEQTERETVIRVLNEVGGNKSIAAEQLGIARSTLYRKLRALGLEQGRFLS